MEWPACCHSIFIVPENWHLNWELICTHLTHVCWRRLALYPKLVSVVDTQWLRRHAGSFRICCHCFGSGGRCWAMSCFYPTTAPQPSNPNWSVFKDLTTGTLPPWSLLNSWPLLCQSVDEVWQGDRPLLSVALIFLSDSSCRLSNYNMVMKMLHHESSMSQLLPVQLWYLHLCSLE